MKKLAILALAPFAACTVPPQSTEPSDALPPLARQQDEPQLAMLEHVLGLYFASDVTNRPTVCAAVHDGREEVAMETADEVALIARFPRLAPLSRCTLSADGWRDHETGEAAMVFTLHSFTCPSTARCTGWAGYRSTGDNSMNYLYNGEWSGSEWIFTRDPRIVAE